MFSIGKPFENCAFLQQHICTSMVDLDGCCGVITRVETWLGRTPPWHASSVQKHPKVQSLWRILHLMVILTVAAMHNFYFDQKILKLSSRVVIQNSHTSKFSGIIHTAASIGPMSRITGKSHAARLLLHLTLRMHAVPPGHVECRLKIHWGDHICMS